MIPDIKKKHTYLVKFPFKVPWQDEKRVDEK